MKTNASAVKKILGLLLFLLPGLLAAQETFVFGATTNIPGGTLVFENASDYCTSNLFCFGTSPGTAWDSSVDGYYTGAQIFSALSATDPNGAAPGTVIQVKLLSVTGPAGASVGFWEADAGGNYGTSQTWSVPVPSTGNTNLIRVTEADDSPANDPYGDIQNRALTFSLPGLYKITWQLLDNSTNGLGGTPQDQPTTFDIYYQAGVTIAGITADANGINITFAATDGRLIYNIEQSPSMGPDSDWEMTGSSNTGNNQIHTVTIPRNGDVGFFRIHTIQNGGGT